MELDVNIKSMRSVGEPFCVNFSTSDASTALVLKEAISDRKIWVESFLFIAQTNSDEITILDGEDDLIGPIVPCKGIPYGKTFLRPVACSYNSPLKIHAAAAFDLHIIVEGFSSNPVPSSSVSASMSASPSE